MYPDFSNEPVLAIDLETKEEQDLKKFGPGSHRHYLDGEDSYILGVAISDSERDYYFPASKETFDWLRSIVKDHLWVGHNILYDLSWLWYEGFRPEATADTMGLVRLLSEDRRLYSLDSCAEDYLNERKNEAELEELCKKHGLRGKPQKWLWKLIELGYGEVVAKYAKKDTRLTFDLYMKLLPEIDKQGLDKIWQIEKDLLPILADTHHRGLRVDDGRRVEASELLGKEIRILKDWLVKKAGCDFNPGSGKQLKPIFDKLNLEYKVNKPTTKMLEKDPKAKGNPSFKGEDLLPFGIDPNMEYFPHVLITHNKLLKLKRDFVDRLHDFMVEGRIHSMVNPYGTKTGRPSAKTPNIFHIPKKGRGKEICRVLFLPEEGEDWASMDYASEEPRIFTHYAVGRGSDKHRANYNNEGLAKAEKYDMHTENKNIVNTSLGRDVCDRPKAKTIGLGVLFGMGDKKAAGNLGLEIGLGTKIVAAFHKANPSFKATSRLVSDTAKQRGYIFTLLGRRRRFPHGEGAYRGLNFLTQGNSADLAKLTIVEAKRRGLLEKMNFLLFLYDEYNISVKPENRKYVQEFRKIGENAIKFRVKMYLDLTYGENWGDCG